MTRRYAPQMIEASHDVTRAAEALREAARPAPVREPEQPAAWEAAPEPTPTPAPKPGRGARIVVEQRSVPRYQPGDDVDDQTIEAVVDLIFGTATEKPHDYALQPRRRTKRTTS